MALVNKDRVRETSTSTGTGNITLAGTVGGFRTFAAAIGVGNTCWYAITGPSGSWETGIGTLSGSTTLVRTTVLESSNGNALVDFAAGTKDVFCTLPASQVPDVSTKASLSGAAFTGRVDLAVVNLGTLTTGSAAVNAANGNVFQATQNGAITVTVSNLANGNDVALNLTWTSGTLSFSGVDRWDIGDNTSPTSFTATAIGSAALVSGAVYQFVFSKLPDGTVVGRVGRGK